MGLSSALSVFQLNSSRCGYSLRTGTLIILWIYVALKTLSFCIQSLVPIIAPSNSTTLTEPTTVTRILSATLGISTLASSNVWIVISGILYIVIGILALLAVYKELRLPQTLLILVWEGIFVTLNFVKNIIEDFSWSAIIVELVILGIFLYCWLIIFSYYRQMNNGLISPIPA